MTTTETTKTTLTNKLIQFVDQKPGLEFNNYGDISAYRKEMREITNDRNDFFELLYFAMAWVGDIEDRLQDYFKEFNSNRLSLNDNGQLTYIVGQYFPTEYRPAAANVLKSIIWRYYANLKADNGNDVYKTTDDIRKSLKRRLSARVYRLYFK